MIRFSRHIRERMHERSIPEAAVLEIVNGEVDCVIYPSTRDEDLDLYFGKSGDRYLLVVCNRMTSTLVTVRPMRKKEKQIFEEVISSDD
jgi:hypothetical protein